MLLSEMQLMCHDSDVVKIINEKQFDRFSRITSTTNEKACVYIVSEQYIPMIPDNVTMVITTTDIADKLKADCYGICISNNPKATYFRFFSKVTSFLEKKEIFTSIGEGCIISKHVYINNTNVEIGNNVIIEDFVTIYDNVKIGDNCVIRSGVKLGVQDYNYFRDGNQWIHLPHYGKLIIENNVEIGFNSVVGKSLYPGDSTVIGEGSKLANCCAIGHDCSMGKKVMVYAGAVIGGWVQIGDESHIKMSATIRNGIKIGKNVQVDMGAVVTRDLSDNQEVFGNPARRIIIPNSRE